jgi:ankyrin repeat protein
MSAAKVAKSAVKSAVKFSPISGRKLMDELVQASKNGDEDTVNRLLEKGTKIGHSLHAAAVEGHLRIVKILVKHGADIHKISKDHDCTPVMVSAWAGNLDVTEYFIKKGALLATNSYRSGWGGVKNAFNDYGFLSHLTLEIKKEHQKVLKKCLYKRLSEKRSI